jgi:type I restriction enzyme M protein
MSERIRFAVIETKKDGISDNEFNQAVEQAAGNGTADSSAPEYIGVVAGLTRRFLDFTGAYGAMEREKTSSPTCLATYGKPQEFKYTKGGALDIKAVSREDLITAIAKCHQTLWQGGKLSPPQAFSELCKLIFVKIADEKAKRKAAEPYQFQIKTMRARRRSPAVSASSTTSRRSRSDVFTETIKVADGKCELSSLTSRRSTSARLTSTSRAWRSSSSWMGSSRGTSASTSRLEMSSASRLT